MNKERYINKLNKIKESGNYRMLRDVQHNGFLIHYNEREMLNLSSNDYLGLASNPVLYEDFRKETDVKLLSYSAVSSRLLSGNHEYYSLLENDLSDLYGKEAALVLNSGYHANIGILPALAGKRDLIVADKLVHASIIDGLPLTQYEHGESRLVAAEECLACGSRLSWLGIVLHIEREVERGLLVVGLGVYYHLLVVGHCIVGALRGTCWYRVVIKETLYLGFNLVDIDVAHYDDALQVGTIPLVVIVAQNIVMERIHHFYMSNRQTVGILRSGVYHRHGILHHALRCHT